MGILLRTIVGYIGSQAAGGIAMKVSDILRVKGGTLFTVSPGESLSAALDVMSQQDIGSLVVMDHGELVGMLTFREVIQAIVKNGGTLGDTRVQTVMDDHPLTCTPETDLDEVRRIMLGRHARYTPVVSDRTPVSYTHLRAHETPEHLVCRLLL